MTPPLLRVIAGATFSLALCPNLAAATDTEPSRELIRVCTSPRAEDIAYCEGYIEGAAHIWKFRAACDPSTDVSRSYCSGLQSAHDEILEAYKACTDCSAGRIVPNEKGLPTFKENPGYTERIWKFRDELKAMMGVCSADGERDSAYCDGYNAEVKQHLAALSVNALKDPAQDARSRGLGEGSGQADATMFGTADFFEFAPCVRPELSAQGMKEVLLRFVRDNPEQQRGAYPVLLLQKALFYGVCPGPSAGLKPHMEQCTEWDYEGNEYVARNTCNRPVVVRFQAAMIASEQTKESQVNAWQTFRTGLTRFEMEGNDWIFTVCPVGHVSDVPFSPQNAEIRASRYSCVRK